MDSFGRFQSIRRQNSGQTGQPRKPWAARVCGIVAKVIFLPILRQNSGQGSQKLRVSKGAQENYGNGHTSRKILSQPEPPFQLNMIWISSLFSYGSKTYGKLAGTKVQGRERETVRLPCLRRNAFQTVRPACPPVWYVMMPPSRKAVFLCKNSEERRAFSRETRSLPAAPTAPVGGQRGPKIKKME